MKKILNLLKGKGLSAVHDTHEVTGSTPVSPTIAQPVEYQRDKTLSDLCSLYLVACGQRNLRPTSILTMRQRILAFVRWTNCEFADQVSRKDVKRFSESFAGKWARSGHRNDVCVFLNWCGQLGYCEEGKFYKVKLMSVLEDENPIDVLSVKDAERLLWAMPDRFKGRTALQLFAGVRPYESLKIQRKDIDFQARTLTVLGEYSKLRRTRVLHDIPNNLIKWVKKFPLKPTSYNAYRLARYRNFGKLPHDAMRHSFCSYGYFFFGMEMTMRFAGHTNYKTFHRHYCESTICKADSEKYFRLEP